MNWCLYYTDPCVWLFYFYKKHTHTHKHIWMTNKFSLTFCFGSLCSIRSPTVADEILVQFLFNENTYTLIQTHVLKHKHSIKMASVKAQSLFHNSKQFTSSMYL